MVNVQSSTIGYPRIGGKREWKRALESFWNGTISEDELLTTTEALRLDSLRKQKELGIDLIPVGDFSLYDHVLDTSIMFGVVPTRFEYTVVKCLWKRILQLPVELKMQLHQK